MDSFLIAVVGFAVGIAAGAFSAFIGWNKSGEPFEARKFLSGVITGAVAGLVLVLGNISGLLSAATNTDVLIQLGALVVTVIGADNLRTAITGAITNRE